MVHRKQAWAKRVKKERFKKRYLTRMQATRLLQVDSMNFRRMCILKGIYPRAIGRSKQKESGNDKQYYLAREMKWLVRDQIASKINAYGAWQKKCRRATAMQKAKDLQVLLKNKPGYSLDATIKERYPYFLDAVKDIDDAMSMIALYAFMSPEINSESTIEFHHALPSGLHQRAKDTVARWMAYVGKSQCLTKSFISIKGYYYEAIVKGERIRWLMPHEYASKFPTGIQQYVLITFLEFYIEMMKNIMFKLEHDLQRDIEEREKAEDEGLNTNAEDFTGADAGVVDQKQQSIANRIQGTHNELSRVVKLFDGFVFYISREVPQKHVSLVITACGGRVVSEVNDNITHYVVDRPSLVAGHAKQTNVEYVQPQYVFDCLNARAVLPAVGYRIGEDLPPHVSPFTVAISNAKEDIDVIEDTKKRHPKILSYVPERVHEIRKFINPNYTAIDPDQKVTDLIDDYSSDEDDHLAPRMDEGDNVSLSGDELDEANRKPEWKEEKVTEHAERSKLSAFQVKKQRELNLMNQPTHENVAMRRQLRAKTAEDKKKLETRDQRVKRKLAESDKQERATRKMQLQVARKKAARYYKMVNSVVEGNKKKEKILASKAQQLASGKSVLDDDKKTIVKTSDVQKRQKLAAKGVEAKKTKAPNPYQGLPNWVR